MLIPSERHTQADLELWSEFEEADLAHAQHPSFGRKVERALDEICDFAARKNGYAGVSWGKDSTVLAHLCHLATPRLRKSIPVVWIKVNPIANPDCDAVEERFLERWWLDYHRIEVECRRDLFGLHATGTLEKGFDEAVRRFGPHHISGVRGDESGDRKRRMRKWGTETIRTLAPLGWWSHADIFAYLAAHDLPIHPAYAMTGGGRWPRDRLRVASMGGRRGDGIGRAEWEREYYGDVLRRLESGHLG